jgi:sporulation protein YlmC with PRC-barrel domain
MLECELGELLGVFNKDRVAEYVQPINVCLRRSRNCTVKIIALAHLDQAQWNQALVIAFIRRSIALSSMGDVLMLRLAHTSILLALMTTVASAQAPAPAPAPTTRAAPGPTAQIHAALPAESVTVTHWYKQNIYDPSDNKIGEIMDVLVDRDGKVSALIVGVGGFLGMGEKDVAVPFDAVKATTKDNNKYYLVMNSTKDALKSAKGFKYDRNAMTWMPEDAPATTGTPAAPAPGQPNR